MKKKSALLITIFSISFLSTLLICCSSSSTSQRTANFFTCTRWMDQDQDGSIAWNEWQNLGKDRFRSYDDVCFVGYFTKPIGTKIQSRLRDPNGDIINTYDHNQNFNTTILRRQYLARDLINENGSGVYRVEWFVEGVLVGESKATLIK